MSLRRWHCAWIFLLLHIHYKQGEPENPTKRETKTWVSYFAHGWCELSKRSVLARPQWFRKNPLLDLCKPHWPFHVQVEACKPPYGVQVQTCFNNGSGNAATVATKIKSWSNDTSCNIKIGRTHQVTAQFKSKGQHREREGATWQTYCVLSCWDELGKRFLFARGVHQVPPK